MRYKIRPGTVVTMWTDLRDRDLDLKDNEAEVVASDKCAALEIVRIRLAEIFTKKLPAYVFEDDSVCVGFTLESEDGKTLARGSVLVHGCGMESRLNIY